MFAGEEKFFHTPDLTHLDEPNFQTIYDPSEETLQFMDGLQSDYRLLESLKADICVEVGSGSGALITFLASMLGREVLSFATDVNFSAAEISEETGKHNSITVCGVCADLLNCMLPRLRGQVDVLLFNPPYVVTKSELVSKPGNYSVTATRANCSDSDPCDIVMSKSSGTTYGPTASYAGGQNGREVMDRLLKHVDHLLSPHGVLYLAAIEDNNIDDIENIMKKRGFRMSILLDRCVGDSLTDKPYLLRFNRA